MLWCDVMSCDVMTRSYIIVLVRTNLGLEPNQPGSTVNVLKSKATWYHPFKIYIFKLEDLTWLYQGNINEKIATPTKFPGNNWNIWMDKKWFCKHLSCKQNRTKEITWKGAVTRLTWDFSPLMPNAEWQWKNLTEFWGKLVMGQWFYNQPGCCSFVKSTTLRIPE